MSCRGCPQQESARHQPKPPVAGDIDSQSRPGFATGDKNQLLQEFRQMTYEQLLAEREAVRRWWAAQAEEEMLSMSDAMRRVHIEELVALANYDSTSPVGMSPEQAVIALKKSLDRPEFSFINDVYPLLRESVNTRYDSLLAQRIPLK